MPAQPMVPVPDSGRRFVGRRAVRLGDVTNDGQLRLDALARYTQDVSNDDTTDAGLADDLAWVVRRSAIDVLAPARFGESLALTTFCGGVGRRWAERRIHVVGNQGAAMEVATLWVHIDPASGRPTSLPAQFLELYGEAAQGRSVGARHQLGAPTERAERRPWAVRAADLDLFGHVNNAAYLAAVEEVLAEHPLAPPYRVEVEYGAGLGRRPGVELAVHHRSGDGFDAWLVGGEVVHAAFALRPGAPPQDGEGARNTCWR